jgi:putative transcriptional regulator
MINHHPSHGQLAQFANGTLAPAVALIISAHIDMCSSCKKKVHTLQSELSEQMLMLNDSDNIDFSDMIDQITDKPSLMTTPSSVAADKTLELDGRHFKLPRALHRFSDRTSGWSHLVGKLWQTQVDVGGDLKAHFIYMEKGGQVPEHTHRGNEYTLVIDGEFSDGLGVYDTGDIMLMNSQKHTPRADADEGCLVFSVLDQPLHFTSGLARMLNPFSHLFFR